MDKTDYVVDNVINSATWINDVLVAGAALAGTVCLLKAFKKQEVKVWGDLTIDLSYSWVVFSIFTAAHFYVTYVFVQAASAAQAAGAESSAAAWNKLTTSTLLFFHGLISRLNCFPNPLGSVPKIICDMDLKDPTTLLAHASAICLFIAVVRWKEQLGLRELAPRSPL
jgi:hypothetical protein